MRLHEAVIHFAASTPEALAVKGPDGEFTYGALDRLSNRIARALAARGVKKGDRVALWLDKSAWTVAAMEAALRLGAAYVPIDPLSPALRAERILADCTVAALVTTRERASHLADPLTGAVLYQDESGKIDTFLSDPVPDAGSSDSDLAYILYTSGSTGRPKGVSISHRNALAFTTWAVEELAITGRDRLANHAPFHFDLSVFDLYAAFQSGASVLLIRDELCFYGIISWSS